MNLDEIYVHGNFISACREGNFKEVKRTIGTKIIDNYAFIYGIIWSASNGHLEVGKYLLTLDCVRKEFI